MHFGVLVLHPPKLVLPTPLRGFYKTQTILRCNYFAPALSATAPSANALSANTPFNPSSRSAYIQCPDSALSHPSLQQARANPRSTNTPNGQPTIRPRRARSLEDHRPHPRRKFLLGGIRAAVHASKDNMAEAHSGALGMIPFAHNIIHAVVPAAVWNVIEHVEEVLRQREEELRRRYWVMAGAWDVFTYPVMLWRFWGGRGWQERGRVLMREGGRGLR